VKDFYVYPAIFTYDDDGISIAFPDLPGCYTCGAEEEEALCMATEALELHLYGMERDGDEIPAPTPIYQLTAGDKQALTLIRANMRLARLEIRNKSVKKTLTIPQWLDEEATERHVNFSQVLQDALKQCLGVSDYCAK
jgi:predicted RNase H-like HicB family nuclease